MRRNQCCSLVGEKSIHQKVRAKGSVDCLTDVEKAKVPNATMTSSDHDRKCKAAEGQLFASLQQGTDLKALAVVGKPGQQIFYKQLEGSVMERKIQVLNDCLVLARLRSAPRFHHLLARRHF